MAPASILQTHANATLYLDRGVGGAADAGNPRRDPRGATPHEARAAGTLRPPGERVRRRRLQRAGPRRPIASAKRCERMRATGVTRCLPTLITSSFEHFAASARVLAGVSDRRDRRHPHGRAVPVRRGRSARRASARARGAASHRRLQPAPGGRRRPDRRSSRSRRKCPARSALIEHLVATGVRVAIGHTAATPEQIADADRPPARRWRRTWATAARRCCRGIPNVDLGAARGRRACVASLIVDGHHLPPATVKAMVRAKGAGRTVLVTDAIAAAGCRARDAIRSAASMCELGDGRPRVAAGHAVPGRLER